MRANALKRKVMCSGRMQVNRKRLQAKLEELQRQVEQFAVAFCQLSVGQGQLLPKMELLSRAAVGATHRLGRVVKCCIVRAVESHSSN